MGKTSTEVKQRWENKAYARYLVRLRKDTDSRLIDYVEKRKEKDGTSNVFREALEELMNNEG